MNISQLFGSGSIPPGGSVLALDATNPFSFQGSEYLRTGTIKAYNASYAASIAAAPQLRVFGSDAKTYGTATSNEKRTVHYIGTNYLSMPLNASGVQYGAALNSMSSSVAVTTPPLKRVATIGASYLVTPANVANTAPNYTANGSTFAATGGTFTTCPLKTAIGSDNVSKWITLSSLSATAGEQAYISAANPSGAWTVGASTNLGMTSVQALAISTSGVVVAAGSSSSTTTGKLASCPSLGGTWVDRTAAIGIPFLTAGNVEDVVFDGTEFIALVYANTNELTAVITSPDGATWTNRGKPVDTSLLNPLSAAGSWPNATQCGSSGSHLTTDRAGTTTLTASTSATDRPVFFISTDHGVTWTAAQEYVGKVPTASAVRTMSYANSRWIYNHSGSYQSIIDIGTSLATPDYVGQQISLAAGQFVRIK